METETLRYAWKPFAVSALAVIAIEIAARLALQDPLLAAGAARVLDAAAIIAAARIFGPGAQLPGIMPPDIKSGLMRGMLWSAGFGGIAAVCGTILYLAGFDPLEMLSMNLPATAGGILVFFLVGGIISPFAEELIFRGLVFGVLRRWGLIVALLGSTAVFAWAHHTRGIPVTQAVGGLVFALSYETEKNLLVPVVIHITGNLALFSLGLVS
ncbi:MAG: CPBP family intramembrane metalloprotease [Desulfobacteraceae bacterium]|nr:CPBP family intramembrane metalloprotease [Desulfobacteraceae bacterium]